MMSCARRSPADFSNDCVMTRGETGTESMISIACATARSFETSGSLIEPRLYSAADFSPLVFPYIERKEDQRTKVRGSKIHFPESESKNVGPSPFASFG